jgi:hypothetical protein
MEAAGEARIAELERGFRRAGLPLFIEGYSASTDVFNRVVPLLGLVFLGELLGALNLDWSPLANIAAALGGIAILLAGVASRTPARAARSSACHSGSGRRSWLPSSSCRPSCR